MKGNLKVIGYPLIEKDLKVIDSLKVKSLSIPSYIQEGTPSFKIKNVNVSYWESYMGINYIKREEIKVTIERLNKKYKGKYRFKARAVAPGYSESNGTPLKIPFYPAIFKSDVVYSKTKHGAKVSAITNLLHKCRPPLSKKIKLKNKELRKKGEEEIIRIVYTEVRISNAMDFIMNDEKTLWHEIRETKNL